MLRKLSALLLIVSMALAISGCFIVKAFVNAVGDAVHPEDNYADMYCGENTKGKVVGDVHHYTDEELGFDYTVRTYSHKAKMQDFEYYETHTTFVSDFDEKYIECFLDEFDTSDLEEEYGLTISIENQHEYMPTIKNTLSTIRFSSAEACIVITTEQTLTDDDCQDIIKKFKKALKKFDTRGHFNYNHDEQRYQHKALLVTILSQPWDEDVEANRNWHHWCRELGL